MKKGAFHTAALLFLFSTAHCQRAFSQEVKVSGQVTDKVGRGLASALVQAAGRQIRTDRYGAFELALKAGTYRFLVQHPACEAQAKTLTLQSDTTIAFVLLRRTRLSEVVFTASRADAQIRQLDHRIQGTDESNTGAEPIEIKDALFFFNPKTGLTYAWDNLNTLYASYARAHREPNRTDYREAAVDHLPKPERLDDWEWGWRYNSKSLSLEANNFYMHYTDQLVRTGALNAVGSPIRTNIGKSYRLGLELSAALKPTPHWRYRANLSLSRNRNQNAVEARGDGSKNLSYTTLYFLPLGGRQQRTGLQTPGASHPQLVLQIRGGAVPGECGTEKRTPKTLLESRF